jgi:hypothetical protein
MCLPAILQCKDVASEQADHESCTHKVELQDYFLPGRFHRLRRIARLEGEERDNGSDTTNWQIDPEAL